MKNSGGGTYNPSLIIKEGVIIGYNFTALIADKCEIGKNTIIAHNVSIITENHGTDIENIVPLHAQPLNSAPVSIGDNCWVGCNVVFLPGSSIGNNCIVGANAVVGKDFPDNTIIGGIPARVLKNYDFEKHLWIKVKDDEDVFKDFKVKDRSD